MRATRKMVPKASGSGSVSGLVTGDGTSKLVPKEAERGGVGVDDQEVHECERWGHVNDWAYKLLQLLVIISSVMVTAALALDQLVSNFPGKLFALIASLVVTSAASALKIFNFPGKVLFYSIRANALKREYYLYRAGDGSYAESADKERLFVRKVEDILAESNKQTERVYFSSESDNVHLTKCCHIPR